MGDLQANTRLRFISWNVKGINNPIKRTRVFTHLKSLNADVMYLQETHLRLNEQIKLKKPWIGQIFCSKHSDKTRGTAILIKKGIPFIQLTTIADNRGRYIIVEGSLYGKRIILANVYGPNFDDDSFFSSFIEALPDLTQCQLILGGDFNFVLHPQLDRSNPGPNSKISKAGTIIHNFMESYALVDPWRYNNPTSKQFSFFSPVHHSYSRIDFFIVDKIILPNITGCQYNSIVISDHSPVQIDVIFPECPRPRRTWRLDPLLMSKDSFKNMLSEQIDYFLNLNQTPEIQMNVLWEALKAYIRGQIISYTAFHRKKYRQQLCDLSDNIKELDLLYAEAPTSELYRKKLLLNTEFESMSIKQTESLFLKSKQTFYEHGERAGKLLSHQIKQSIAANTISEISKASGDKSADPYIINDEFKQFYCDLYSSEPVDNIKLTEFLDGIPFPQIPSEDRLQINKEISINEVVQAIKSMQSSKAPGPDGFIIEFYKSFVDKLAPILKSVYQEAFNLGKLQITSYNDTSHNNSFT